MAEPIATLPKVMTSPNSSSPAAHRPGRVGEDQVAQAARIERDEPAEHQHGGAYADGEIDGEEAEQRDGGGGAWAGPGCL